MTTPSQGAGTAVVGYFATGDEAHRAINALVAEGFQSGEIGAAFHTGSATSQQSTPVPENADTSRRPNVGGELRDELGTTYPGATTKSFGGPAASGAASGTESVQYAVLGGGAGTPMSGAGRPGPITASDVEHSGLPTELKSELPHEGDIQRGTASVTSTHANPTLQQSTPTQTLGETHKESWGERLKHVFGGGSSSHYETKYDKDDLNAEMRRESRDFGTGEGHLNLHTPPSQRYSQPAFEKSFGGYGVESSHARHLSQRIGGGGAIVTVHAGARTAEAERILEANGGQTRLSPGSRESDYTTESNVEVYGSLHRDYPTYL